MLAEISAQSGRARLHESLLAPERDARRPQQATAMSKPYGRPFRHRSPLARRLKAQQPSLPTSRP
jgi:hypothetical protein